MYLIEYILLDALNLSVQTGNTCKKQIYNWHHPFVLCVDRQELQWHCFANTFKIFTSYYNCMWQLLLHSTSLVLSTTQCALSSPIHPHSPIKTGSYCAFYLYIQLFLHAITHTPMTHRGQSGFRHAAMQNREAGDQTIDHPVSRRPAPTMPKVWLA